MEKYRKAIQKKIRDDLAKLSKYEPEINEMLDGIAIKQWVLITPEFRSKELIKYCQKKKKEILLKSISFIDTPNFQVKIETAESFPAEKIFALSLGDKAVNIPLKTVTEQEMKTWPAANTSLFNNIQNKTSKLIPSGAENFKDHVISNYIQIDKFLDDLRSNHPDLYVQLEDTARARLADIGVASIYENLDQSFVRSIVESNRESFLKYAEFMSDENNQTLSFGYLSKWISECDLDFLVK